MRVKTMAVALAPVLVAGLEVPEQFLGLTGATADHPTHGRLEAGRQALADLVPRIRVGTVPSMPGMACSDRVIDCTNRPNL